jgi:CDP-diglyceride synthetase
MINAWTAMPLWALGLVVVGLAMGVGVAGLAVTRRWMRAYRSVPNDLAGFVFAVVGVCYAVLFGMSALSAYEQYKEADRTLALEAHAVGDLYRDLEGYPRPPRDRLQGLLAAYVHTTLNEELPALRAGSKVDDTGRLVDPLVLEWVAFEPRTAGQQALHAQALAEINRFLTLRRERQHHGQSGLHPVIWVVLLGGAWLTIGFTYLFWAESHQLHGLMVACLAGVIGLVVFWILAMDRPLQGPLAVTPDGFVQVESTIRRLSATP